MAKISFNGEEIKGKIVPKLSDAIDQLTNVLNIEANMRIPIDFKYADYMKSLYGKNKQLRDDLVLVNEWILKSERELDNALKEMQYNADSINRINLSVITSRIK